MEACPGLDCLLSQDKLLAFTTVKVSELETEHVASGPDQLIVEVALRPCVRVIPAEAPVIRRAQDYDTRYHEKDRSHEDCQDEVFVWVPLRV